MSAYNTPPELARLINDLAARLSALERTRPIISVTADPTGTPPEGAIVVNSANGKLWVGYGGAWHYVVLT